MPVQTCLDVGWREKQEVSVFASTAAGVAKAYAHFFLGLSQPDMSPEPGCRRGCQSQQQRGGRFASSCRRDSARYKSIPSPSSLSAPFLASLWKPAWNARLAAFFNPLTLRGVAEVRKVLCRNLTWQADVQSPKAPSEVSCHTVYRGVPDSVR